MGRASGTAQDIYRLKSEAHKRAVGLVHIVATGFKPLNEMMNENKEP
jgi:hypothetical protein